MAQVTLTPSDPDKITQGTAATPPHILPGSGGHIIQGVSGIPVDQENILELQGMSFESGPGKTVGKTGYVNLQSFIPAALLPAINNFSSLVNLDTYIDDCIATLDVIGAKLFIPPGQYCTSGGLVKTTTRGDLGRGFLFDTFWHLTVDADGAIIICDPTIPPLTRTTFSGRAAIEANCFGLEFHDCRLVTWNGITMDGNAPNLHVDAYASTVISFNCYKLVFNRYTRKNDRHQTSFRGKAECCGINGLTDIEGNDYDSHIRQWIGFREPDGITDGIMDSDPTPDITVYAESFGGDTHDPGGFKFFIEVEAGGTTYRWGRQAFTTDKLIVVRTTAAHGKSVNDAITITDLDAAVNGLQIVCQVIDSTHLAYLVRPGPASVTDQDGGITEGGLTIDQVTLEDGIVWTNGVAFHTAAIKLVNPLDAERLAYDPPLEMPIIQWASDGAHTVGATYGFMHIDAQISGIGFGDPDLTGAHDNFLKNAEIRSGGGAFSWAYGQKDLTLDTCVWRPPAWWADLPGGKPASSLYGNQYGTFWAGKVDGLKVIDSDIQIDSGEMDNVTIQNCKCPGIISFTSISGRHLKNYKINGLHFYDVFDGPGPQAGWGGDADYAASTIAGWGDHCLVFAGAEGNTYGFDGLQLNNITIGGAAGSYVMASLVGTATFGKNTNQVVPLSNVQLGNIQAPTTHCLLPISDAFQAFVPDAIDTAQAFSITVNPAETTSNTTSYAGRFRNFDNDGQASSYGLIGLIKNRGITASPSGTKVGVQGTAVKDTNSNTGILIALAGAVVCNNSTAEGGTVVNGGIISQARAISSSVSLVSGVTATIAMGGYSCANEGSAGTSTTAYAWYFAPTTGTVTNRNNLYAPDTGPSTFGGPILCSDGLDTGLGAVHFGLATMSYGLGLITFDYNLQAPGYQGIGASAPAPLPHGAKFADNSIQTTAASNDRLVINRGNVNVVLTTAELKQNPLVIVPEGYTVCMSYTGLEYGCSFECYGGGSLGVATGGMNVYHDTLGSAFSSYTIGQGVRVSYSPIGGRVFMVEPLANPAHSHTKEQIGAIINGADAIPYFNTTDRFALSVSSVLKYVTWTNIQATLKTYFDNFYAAITHGPSSHVPIVLDAYLGTGGAQAFVIATAGSYMPIPFSYTNVAVTGVSLEVTGDYAGRITCNLAGKYAVSLSVGCTDATGTDFILLGLFKAVTLTSGVMSAATACNVFVQGTANVARQQLSTGVRFIELAAGDKLMLGVTRVTTTGTITVYKGQTGMSLQYLGA